MRRLVVRRFVLRPIVTARFVMGRFVLRPLMTGHILKASSCFWRQRIMIMSKLGLAVQTSLTCDLITVPAVAITTTATTATTRLVITTLGLTRG
jgi:hypothetical protein